MVEGSAADPTREAGAWPEESEFESGSAPRLIRAAVFSLVLVVRLVPSHGAVLGSQRESTHNPSVSAFAAGSRVLRGSRGFAACS